MIKSQSFFPKIHEEEKHNKDALITGEGFVCCIQCANHLLEKNLISNKKLSFLSQKTASQVDQPYIEISKSFFTSLLTSFTKEKNSLSTVLCKKKILTIISSFLLNLFKCIKKKKN